jgi:integrase
MIYNYYEIELQPLPKIDTRRLKQSPPISYKDLPDKDVIRAALNIASPVMKPLILFMASSGCAKAETLNLTIQDYINATREYHNTNNIYQVIDTLNQIEDVIPTWEILRVKTNKYYTTYSSPESVHAINNYLVSRKDPLTPDKKLFKIGNTTFTLNFEEINDELGLGYIGKYRRFRSHMIRKFHASALYNDGMALDKVNDLQGKTKNRTDSVYFMTNPEDLKYEYVEHLPVLTMSKDVEKVTVKSPEFHRLENELREKTDAVESMSNRMDNMERMLQEIANQNVTWEDVKKEY